MRGAAHGQQGRTGVSPGRRRLLAVLTVLLVALFILVEALLIRSYGNTERTTYEFKRTTDATTAIANVQREALLLNRAVAGLRAGDSVMEVALRRGLLGRQIDVVAGARPNQGALLGRMRRMRARLIRFDANFTRVFGTGPRAEPGPGKAALLGSLRQLEREIKETFDVEEQALYEALRHSLDQRARDQLLVIVLSALALLVAAMLGLIVWRAIRGDFARAYGLLDRSQARFQRLVEQIPGIVYVLRLGDREDPTVPAYVSPQAGAITGVSSEEWEQSFPRLRERVPPEDLARIDAALERARAGGSPEPIEFRLVKPDGEEIWLRDSGAVVRDSDTGPKLQGLLLEVTAAKRAQAERDEMELELRLAQKLEAVGQLAAGIAHEINTPIQFVGDTLGFLREGFDELMALQAVQHDVSRAVKAGTVPPELVARLSQAEDLADLEYLRERVPAAFDRGSDGIQRVATIVRAMREFAHPPTSEKAPVDLNDALRNTLVVATNAHKYVADVETDLEDLPPVVCNGGDLNQVFLNLIVNAAHAIEDQVGESGERGTIRVTTRHHGDDVLVSIGDSGCGIPPAIADRIFDPFFSTKEVGRGTGQGLAITRKLVVERHGGSLTFETEADRGTTFHVRLPIGDREPRAEVAHASA